ncbi:unnamed protein product [Diabrotica balteata]|uniref:Uncharacterized protein n=1 Tax=Diabrotica balteata TaxID=107213 RepID=A0A9N9T4B0_DIABA|nr:unnamed protein product [Diabrotica balteata]
MFDETTDMSHTSQMALTLRYVNKGKVREDFVKFIDVRASLVEESNTEAVDEEPEIYEEINKNIDPMVEEIVLSGETLGRLVLKTMNELSLDIKKCV